VEEPLASVLRIEEWTEQETYSLWYKEGRLGTRAVGEPAGVNWPFNGLFVSVLVGICGR